MGTIYSVASCSNSGTTNFTLFKNTCLHLWLSCLCVRLRYFLEHFLFLPHRSITDAVVQRQKCSQLFTPQDPPDLQKRVMSSKHPVHLSVGQPGLSCLSAVPVFPRQPRAGPAVIWLSRGSKCATIIAHTLVTRRLEITCHWFTTCASVWERVRVWKAVWGASVYRSAFSDCWSAAISLSAYHARPGRAVLLYVHTQRHWKT